MKLTYTINELPQIAKSIIDYTDSKILLFNGKMGSGKTTLIKEIVKQLGVDSNISSPTFSLVNEYLTNTNKLIYHFDFYRIENEEEALNIGVEEYFNANTWCLIEWPENVENLLPLDAVAIYIQIIDEHTRVLEIK